MFIQNKINWLIGGIVLFFPYTVFSLDIGGEIKNIDKNDPKFYGHGDDLFTIFIDYARKFKYVIVILAILFIVIAGVRIITASGNEEIVKKNRTSVIWLIVGLLVMQLAEVFVTIMLNQGRYQGFGWFESYANDVPGQLHNSLVNPLLNFMMTFVAVVAILMIVIAALKMMTAMGDEGKIKKQQQMMIGAVVGLAIIALAKPVVKWFYGYGTSDPSVNVEESANIVVRIANYIMGFTFVAAVVMLIIAGIMMVVNFGNDQRVQKARKVVMWTLIGLALILCAYTIVLVFISPQ